MPTHVTHIGTLVTSKWHACDRDMSQLCQHDGTTDTIVFNLTRRIKPNQDRCNASINKVILAVNNLTEIANKMIPKNLRII